MCAGILGLHPLTESVYGIAELRERFRTVAVVGVAHAFKGALETDCRHVERSAVSARHACVHILYAARLVDGTAGVKVDLKVADGFERDAYLKVFAA